MGLCPVVLSVALFALYLGAEVAGSGLLWFWDSDLLWRLLSDRARSWGWCAGEAAAIGLRTRPISRQVIRPGRKDRVRRRILLIWENAAQDGDLRIVDEEMEREAAESASVSAVLWRNCHKKSESPAPISAPWQRYAQLQLFAPSERKS